MKQKIVRVLPDDVYHALHFSALAFGGIGKDHWTLGGVPVCVVGHAELLGPGVIGSLAARGIRETENDLAVADINRRRGKAHNARVTFRQWCKELNVIPESAATPPQPPRR